jgi:hypothetical protein
MRRLRAERIAGQELAMGVGPQGWIAASNSPVVVEKHGSARESVMDEKDMKVMGLPIGIGIVIGIVVGAVIGGSFAIGIGIVIGMLVGAAIGAMLRASSKPQS